MWTGIPLAAFALIFDNFSQLSHADVYRILGVLSRAGAKLFPALGKLGTSTSLHKQQWGAEGTLLTAPPASKKARSHNVSAKGPCAFFPIWVARKESARPFHCLPVPHCKSNEMHSRDKRPRHFPTSGVARKKAQCPFSTHRPPSKSAWI